MTKLVLFNKPYGVHSQFKKDHDGMITLADFIDDKTMRVAGRLDKRFRRAIIMTDNGRLNHAITTPPTAKMPKISIQNVPRLIWCK